FSAFPAILTCLITPSIAGRLRPRWIGVAAASVLIGAGFAGLLVVPVTGAYAWMTLLGMGQGAAISLSLSCMVWRARGAPPPRRPGVAAASVLIGAGFAGLLVVPVPGAYAWMTLLGMGQGAAISLSLSFIVWRSPDAHHTGHVSTMAQGFGYLFAGLGPFGLGWLHTATGSWTAPLLALIILLVFQLVIGAFASQDRHVRARSTHTREVVLR